MKIEEETIEKVKEEPTRSPQAGPSKYTCLQCLAEFKEKKNLNKHVTSVHGEKKFKSSLT